MPSTQELFEQFVVSRLTATPDPDDRDFGDTFRTSEHQLYKLTHGSPHIVAGWQHAGTPDAELWIANEWRGSDRRQFEDALRAATPPLIIMTVLPDDHPVEILSDVIWWAHPAECMSCGADLHDGQRMTGLCPDCVALRGDTNELFPEGERHGIQQQRGLHGTPLPRSRPSDR